jgi:hypothetical protein
MHLVEAEAVGPVEGDAPLVTPPRPPHRRVSVSLLFTLTVLTGTVVAIYLVFPARNNVLLTESIARHRDPSPVWELTQPTPAELRAWVIGFAGKDAPLPQTTAAIQGARRIEVLHRDAAVIRLSVGDDDVTYVIQRAQGIAPKQSERTDGELRAFSWRRGAYTLVVVGPAETAASWRAAFP